MENCLVTKLKAKVSGDDFAELNTLYLDLNDNNINRELSSVIIFTGDEAVDVTFTLPVNLEGSSNMITSLSIPANSNRTIQIKNSLVGENSKDYFMKIVGGIYKLRKLCSYNSRISFSDNTKKNLQALNFNPDLAVYGGGFNVGDSIPESVRYLVIGNNSGTRDVDLSNYNINMNNIEVIHGSFNAQDDFYNTLLLDEKITNAKNLRQFNCRLQGLVTLFPVNINYVGNGSSGMTGKIEDFVEKARKSGRTSGYIEFKNKEVLSFTYKDIAIKNYSSSEIPVVGSSIYLTWDSSNIVWASSVPDNREEFKTPYYWEPAN